MSDDDWFLGEPGTADVSNFAVTDTDGGSAKPAIAIQADHRNAQRYNVHWKMAVVFEDQENKPTYRGKTHDLSLSGTAMLTDVNIKPTSSPVIILLAPPPLHVKDRPKVVEIKARQHEAVYSGESRCFRLGFSFLEFKRDSLDYLTERLSHHQSVAKVQLTRPVQ